MVVASTEDFLSGGGEMGERIRSFDWANSPLGPFDSWQNSLKTTVRLLLNSRYPMFLWWGDEYVNIYNDAYIPVLGNRHPHALGQPATAIWSDIWHDVGPQAEAVFEAGKSTWNDRVLLVMERYGFAEETYFTFSYSPAPRDDGAIGGVFCACTEETERVLSERRLRALRQLMAVTTEAASAEEACQIAAESLAGYRHDVAFALIYLIDSDGTHARLAGAEGIVAGSTAAPLLVSLTADASSPWPLSAALTGKSLPLDGLRPLGLSGGVWPEPCDRAMVLPLLKGGRSELVGFLVSGASPYRPLDDAYQGFFDLLADSIANAVAKARSQEETRKRVQALAEIDRAKSIFFSNVSHELRTPLTLILGPLEESIRDEATPQPLRKELQVAHRNGLRLLRLVNTMLDFSRIEAGRMQAVYEPVDLATVTAELASVFRSAIERAGLDFIIDCPTLPEPVYVDRDMWEKIMLNLLSNALKFTFHGRIRVSLHVVGGEVELQVSDSGTGIPEQELPLVFRRFHRIAGARGRTHEGSGIGLALVAELAKLHGGSVAVQSRMGEGSTFSVRIPIGASHLSADQISTASRPLASFRGAAAFSMDILDWLPEVSEQAPRGVPTQPADRDAYVLAVDDNADMRSYLERVLLEKYEVRTAPDGQAALEAISERLPDLILSDVMMPRVTGIELLQSLRSNPATASVPVVLLTARADEQSMIEAMEARADDYLTKPFSARELLARVGGHIAIAKLRREASESLRASEARLATQVADFETLLRELPVGIAVAQDPECKSIRVNLAFAEMLGMDQSANASKTGPTSEALPFKVLQQGVEVPADQLPMQVAAREAREVRDFEADIVRADGTISHELGHAVPLVDDTGAVRGSLAVFIDITERTRAEEALRESEQRFRNMAENAPVMIWVTDTEGKCVYINRQWRDFTGTGLQENLGLGWIDFAHPEDQEMVTRTFLAANAARESFRFEYRLRRHDGEWRWTVDSGDPRFGEDGAFLGYIGSVIDITERREMEHALRESEDQLARAQAAAGIGSWNWQPQTGTSSFSGEYFALYGLPSNQQPLTFEDWMSTIHPADQPRMYEEMQRALRETHTLDVQFRIVRPDGSIRWLAGKGTVFCDRDGAPIRFTGVNFDITARKEAEQELLRSNDDLKQFAFAASHDLQEPLRIVINYTQLLERRYKSQLDERAATIIDTAVEAALRMERLLKGLRDYWQVSERQIVPVSPVDLNTVVRDTLHDYDEAIQAAQATITCAHLPVVLAAETPMTQVFQNLITNALKYRHAGRPLTIHISSERTATEHVISVSDNGIGINPQYAEQVFGIFKRLHGQEYSGSGIGLAICQKIVERFGGKIWVASDDGQGSTFRFTLPTRGATY